MPNRSTDALFQLVKSLEKSEKRNFKLFVKRNSASDDLKIIQLFDALDKMADYDEATLLKKNKAIRKQQLSNMKAHLYKQILASLRIIKDENNIDIQLHELMDHARILYNKGLYLQTLKALKQFKDLARANNQISYLQQALFFEKKIEALYITRSMQHRADELCQEADNVNSALTVVNRLSNLSLQLYSWYIQHGHARNEKDMRSIQVFFQINLPPETGRLTGFYERLYLYQSYCWYAFIRLDFLQYYRYCQKWVDLFDTNPDMLAVETASYIKAMHNLMSAHFDLLNSDKLAADIKKFEQFARHKLVTQNDNNRILTYQYLYTARINLYFLQGTFEKGLKMVPFLEDMLKEYGIYLDTHRVLVFYYKIACLYFGSGNNEKAIDYLNRIINQKADLRTDLQCYARLLHLIAHYELGNFDLLEYLIKSVYRYMARMENLSKVEDEMFAFLRRSFHVGAHALTPEFEKLLVKLKKYEGNPLESRAFAYLDVISWLESKINKVNVQDVIREKYARRKSK
jgi:tetratricopeptide (TPR) repeat protein